MDYYNMKAAAATLQELALDVSDERAIYLHHLSSIDLSSRFRVKRTDNPKSWVLMTKSSLEPTEASEVVFTVRGMLNSKNLPPLETHQIPRAAHRARYLRQQVEISGLDLPYFETLIGNVHIFHAMFERCFAENQLEKWQAHYSATGLSIYAGNRILSPFHEVKEAVPLPVPRAWDPSERLGDLVLGSDLVFTEDNLVLYYERTRSLEFSEVSPVVFRIGDLVQIQISLTIIPVGPRKFRMMTILRSLALLSDVYSKHALMERCALQEHARVTSPLKRKIGYKSVDDELTEDAVERGVGRMRVDEQ